MRRLVQAVADKTLARDRRQKRQVIGFQFGKPAAQLPVCRRLALCSPLANPRVKDNVSDSILLCTGENRRKCGSRLCKVQRISRDTVCCHQNRRQSGICNRLCIGIVGKSADIVYQRNVIMKGGCQHLRSAGIKRQRQSAAVQILQGGKHPFLLFRNRKRRRMQCSASSPKVDDVSAGTPHLLGSPKHLTAGSKGVREEGFRADV